MNPDDITLLASLLKAEPVAAEVPAAALSIAPRRLSGRLEGDYTLTLRNAGALPASFALRADDPRRLLGYELGQTAITLAAGQSARVHLTVEAPRRLLGGPEQVPFAVFAEPSGGEPVAAEAEFTHLSLLPPWLTLLLVALAGALLLAILLTLLP